MKDNTIFKTVLGLAFIGQFSSSAVIAQNDQMVEEEVITIGTRTTGRTATEAAVPVDIISSEDFVNQGDTDLSNLLRNVVPSYNVNVQPISDAATIVRPANLRGLAPDHTLVLVNGKRRHRAAVIYWLGNGVADGAQGPDISVFPAVALKQAEVLRDGAAAQYGSDAIAGVMNFSLKDASEGSTFEVRTGEFYDGDGAQNTISGNIGLPFTQDGFANFSFEYGNTDPTDRSIQRSDAQGLIDAGNSDINDPAQIWGQPLIRNDVKIINNIGLDLSPDMRFYTFGNYAEKRVEGGFYFRNPDTRGGVFSPDGGQTRLVADLNPNNTLECPQNVPVNDDSPASGSAGQAAALLASIMDNSTALGAECFVFNEMFPGGFTPRFGGEVQDFAQIVGVSGETLGGLSWDVSAAVGRNDVDFFIVNTVNASLGPQTPTEFDPGAYTQTDTNFNIDVAYPFASDAFASDINVAGGFEYREEEFEVTVGDQESFEIGPYADQGFSAASNGFAGFSPLAGGKFNRANVAAYVDVETEVTSNWLVAVAARWENFDDFGSTSNGKFATNLAITDEFAVRGSVSTGFRAPTPGQSNAFNVSTEFDSARGDLVNNGTIPSTNPVAMIVGGQPLDPEKSTNFTLGTVFDFDAVTLTIDYFSIELQDRITVSQNFQLTDEQVQSLIDSGVTSAANLQNFRFFTNDFDTTTTGVDVVATTSAEWLGGQTDFSLAFNTTETTVDSFTPEVVDEVRIRELQEGLPQTRWNIAANHSVGDWRFLTRLSYYDEFYDSEDDRTYGEEFIVDAEVAFDWRDDYTFILGAQNIFDEYPEENPLGADQTGRRYSQFSPSGFGGGYWYLRLQYRR